MELLTEKQVTELIVDYENRNKGLVEKIKEELQTRKELKKKLEEAKQREALQLQILEKLEESEKMVKKELELVTKTEDNESLKQLAMIKKYEDMLNEQANAWEKYKEQYESLPSVKEVRKAEVELLCSEIVGRLFLQKMKDTQRMVQLRALVRKKKEQAEIIHFAKLYVQHVKKQKHRQQLWVQNKKLTAQAQQLRKELQEMDKTKLQKLDAEHKKASVLMKPQQLPQVDLSRFIIHRDKGTDKLDTVSLNSYILEEEYINNNGESISKLNNSQNKAMDVDNQDSMHMDVDTQGVASQELARSNETPRRLDFKGALANEGNAPPVGERNGNEMQNHVQSHSSNQSWSQVGEHSRTADRKMDSQESHSSDASGHKHSARKRVSQKPPQNEEDATMDASFASNENTRNSCATPYDRPVPTPAKMTKSSFQEKHPHQQTSKQEVAQQHQYQQEMSQQNQQALNRSAHEIQRQTQFQQHQKRSSQEMMQQQQQQQPTRHSSQEMYQQQQMSYQQNQQQQSRHPPQEYQQNQLQREMYSRSEQRQASQQRAQVPGQNPEQRDFSRLPTNKPRILSNEYVSYDLQTMQRKQTQEIQSKPEPTHRASMETPTSRNVMMPKNDSTPFAYHVPLAESSVNGTHMSAQIDPSSMMSPTMSSIENVLPDNISAYLGSEITEPGGSFELARRFHESDVISEDGDSDFEGIVKNFVSPLHLISPKIQLPRAPENTSAQPPANNSSYQTTQDSNSNSNDRGFKNFGGSTTTQTKKLF